MIIGIPPYSDAVPVEYSARCVCGQRYLILNQQALGVVGDAEGRARERAGQMHTRFVDSRVKPFVLCAYGQSLDFSAGGVAQMVM